MDLFKSLALSVHFILLISSETSENKPTSRFSFGKSPPTATIPAQLHRTNPSPVQDWSPSFPWQHMAKAHKIPQFPCVKKISVVIMEASAHFLLIKFGFHP